MLPKDERQVLGIRELHSTADLNPVVVVWMPTETGHGDFECRYEISGIDKEIGGRSIGIDGIQAVLLALKKIGSDLRGLEEHLNIKVFIGSGGPSASHGFPEIENAQQFSDRGEI